MNRLYKFYDNQGFEFVLNISGHNVDIGIIDNIFNKYKHMYASGISIPTWVEYLKQNGLEAKKIDIVMYPFY